MSGYRLPAGGRFVDRTTRVEYFLDGGLTRGLAGDTVASAMLSQGRRTVARSFKYHRPRGIFSAGPEEQNALVTVGPRETGEPNLPATMVEIAPDLRVATQNGWPSVKTDLLAVNGLFGRFLSAGFYYKTFMGPSAKSWMVFEPFIRRAAGLGRLGRAGDGARRERTNAFCDVLVVGAGPAGLAAALTAGRAGARVIVADEGPHPGGDLFEARATIDGRPAAEWAEAARAELAALPNVACKPRTSVVGYYDDNVVTAVERMAGHGRDADPTLPRERHVTIHAGRVVLATGAVERPYVFPGNDLPGVMLAGAVERYATRYGVAAGRRIVLSGATDSLYRAALNLADAGATVVAVADARPAPGDPALAEAVVARGIAHYAGALVTRARGGGTAGVRAVEIAAVAPEGAATAAPTGLADPAVASERARRARIHRAFAAADAARARRPFRPGRASVARGAAERDRAAPGTAGHAAGPAGGPERAGASASFGGFGAGAAAAAGSEAAQEVDDGTGILVGGRPIATLEADVVGVSAGWSPLVHLASQAGGAPVWDGERACFLPGAPREAWVAAGALAGVGTPDADGLAAALASGTEAARHELAALGREAAAIGFAVAPAAGPGGTAVPGESEAPGADAASRPAAQTDAAARAAARTVAGSAASRAAGGRGGRARGGTPVVFAVRPRRGGGKAFVDLQNDVTRADVALAHREGYRSVEHLKRYTTLGMATDQGRTSNVNGLALMAHHRGRAIPEVGTTRFRAPASPVALGTLAGRETGEHFRPVRLSPMHDWHVAAGAEMVATGQWLRPRVYPRAGESVTDAYVRETRAVREAAGMVDVSTLGKIAVVGPDAGAFLNRVYVNGFAKLPVGKARYGVMLREDGFVFDDGTVWRLAEDRYLMTTTTANAAAVLAHLEWLLAVDFPSLRVAVTSVTDQWAGFAIAGPLSGQILSRLATDADLSEDGCPFMGIVRGHVAGRPVMIARLSFSGELAYEVMTGTRDGLAVWRAVHDHGSRFGLVPYGTEALGALRTEKGHVSGPELDGRTTLDDLGLARMASTKKAFVGKALMDRPAMTAPDRLQLVGLRALEPRPIRAGAQLIARDANPHGPAASQGHVTSPTYSPALGEHVALALLAGGRGRTGEELLAAYPLDADAVPVVVVSPHFLDPQGERTKQGAGPLEHADPGAPPPPPEPLAALPRHDDPWSALPDAGTRGGRGAAAASGDVEGAVRIAAVKPVPVAEIAAWPETVAAVASRLGGDGAVPDRPGRFAETAGGLLVRLGPGRLVAIGPAAADLAEAFESGTAAVTDLSHARASFRIAGAAAADVLLAGVAIDLHPDVFPPGAATATRIGHLSGLLLRRAPTVFDVFVPSTYARAFADWLTDAATPAGWRIEAPESLSLRPGA